MLGLFPGLQPLPPPEPDPDVAYTPPEVAAACTQAFFRGLPSGLTWEPCAGAGAWLPAIRKFGPVVATELDPKAESVWLKEATAHNAMLGPPAGAEPRYILTNPPFSCAAALLRAWLKIPSVEIGRAHV